jgi:hypothetical protein
MSVHPHVSSTKEFSMKFGIASILIFFGRIWSISVYSECFRSLSQSLQVNIESVI